MANIEPSPVLGGSSTGKIVAIALATAIAGALIGVGGKTALDRYQARQAAAAIQGELHNGANIEKQFADIDTNNSGSITLDEFRTRAGAIRAAVEQRMQAQQKLKAEALKTQLAARFKTLDKDHSGGIDKTEFAQMPAVKSDKLVVPPFAELDSNKDGALQLEEYISLVRRLLIAGSKPAAAPTH